MTKVQQQSRISRLAVRRTSHSYFVLYEKLLHSKQTVRRLLGSLPPGQRYTMHNVSAANSNFAVRS